MKELVKCNICGKEFSTKGIGSHKWRVHGAGQGFSGVRGKVGWSKGLTKETDERIRKQAEKLKRVKTALELELDDDNKLIQKWRDKCMNAKQEGLTCELTFDEYCLLVKQAGLKSSDLGFTGRGYVLARYNDEGNYTFDNCRFITQKQNSDEEKISEKVRQNGRIQVKNMNAKNHELLVSDPKAYSERIKKGKKASKRYNDIQKDIQLLCSDSKSAKSNSVGVHNSHYGTFWITNGKENKKWRPEKGDLPEGFYRGRTML